MGGGCTQFWLFSFFSYFSQDDKNLRAPNEAIASVELFNWKTGEHCQLKDLPYPISGHTGLVVNGIPVFCGGYSNIYETRCYQLNKGAQTWEQVNYDKHP